MSIIDKSSRAYIEAAEQEAEAKVNLMIDPPDPTGPVKRTKRRTEEVKYFLETNTLSVLERVHNIATDNLWRRDGKGNKVKVDVPPGVQLSAATDFLDRAMGKPQVSVDLTSGDRPIVIDPALMATPLVQCTYEPTEQPTIESSQQSDTTTQLQ